MTLESLLFVTPEQRVLRLLLGEPTTSFSMRTIISKLKGVRGLGGVDGLTAILESLEGIGLAEFLDNRRLVRLREDGCPIKLLKRVAALCDLEGLRALLEPVSTKGVLFGSRAEGEGTTDSEYNLLVVATAPDEARRLAERHPLARQLELTAVTPQAYQTLQRTDPGLDRAIGSGIVLWGSAW